MNDVWIDIGQKYEAMANMGWKDKIIADSKQTKE